MTVSLWGCNEQTNKKTYRPSVVTSSEIIAIAVKEIGEEFVVINQISSSPHTPIAPSPKEMTAIASSDIIFFDNAGFNERLATLMRRPEMVNLNLYPILVAADIDDQADILSAQTSDAYYRLDASAFAKIVSFITDNLARVSPENERIYRRNEELLLVRVAETDKYIMEQAEKIPTNKRIIITNGDSFKYFAQRYGFQNAYLTSVEQKGHTTAKDFARLAKFIKENNIKTVFTEYGVSPRNMIILKNNLSAQGYKINMVGPLYSNISSGETYAEMMTHNIDTITKALMDDKL